MHNIPGSGTTWSCNCIGPQNGQPRCPCMMRGVFQRNGRWVQAEQDLGPVSPSGGSLLDANPRTREPNGVQE
jgi:hypothetical protein